MDQVLTVLEKHLGIFTGNDGDSATTSTMINNYVKQNVVLSPVKKKYQKEQLAQLLIIGIAKRVLSISEIDELIRFLSRTRPLKEAYDLFCETFENALKVTFGEKPCGERYCTGSADSAVTALNAACLAVADKILVTKILLANRKAEENEKTQKKKSAPGRE